MKLGDVVTLRKGNTIEIQDSESYRISGIQNYGKGVIVRRGVTGAELTMRQYQVIEPNQLMWCKVDTKNGAFGVTHLEHAGTLASPNMALADIDLQKADPTFLETLFRVQSFADYITKLSSGTTNRKYLTPPDLLNQVQLPDWSREQQSDFVRKLRKIEECGLAKEIAHQEALLSKLKQAILQEAIEGKLTTGWRGENPDVEPASELLKRIQTEKARLIAAKKLRAEKPLPPIKPEEVPFEVPEGWVWVRLGDVLSFSSGDGLTSAQMLEGDIPVFGGNGINGFHNLANVDQETIVVGRVGANCGSVHKTPKKAWITDNAFITTYSDVCIQQEFLILLLRFLNLNQLSYDCSQPVISGKRIYPVQTPIPPISEQEAIVERVEELMESCRALEEEIERAKEQAGQLLQAVLKEAFA
jgi:type I restriction enzyme S subunit